MLHITNGDSAAIGLRQSGISGDAIQADVLHEGPCPTDASPTEWREVRARYLASQGYTTYDEALERLVEWDAALHAARSHDEVVFWFEHDLFDQLILLRLLSWFSVHGAGSARLSLVCVNSYPGFVRFSGLGQLTGPQLAALFPGRAPVTDAHLRLGHEAWHRFGAPDPAPFAALLGADTRALPFLNASVRRALEEYPSTLNGLSRSEHQASPLSPPARPIPRLRVPLGAADGARHLSWATRAFSDWRARWPKRRCRSSTWTRRRRTHRGAELATLTPLGREVLAGRADHARLNGIDRSVGGVYLRGHSPGWRWDAPSERSSRKRVATDALSRLMLSLVDGALAFGLQTCARRERTG